MTEVLVDDDGTPYAVKNDATGLYYDMQGVPFTPEGDRLMSEAEYASYLAELHDSQMAEVQAASDAQAHAEYVEGRDAFLGSDPAYADIDPDKFDQFAYASKEDETPQDIVRAYRTYQRDPLGSAIESIFSEE